MRLKTGFVLGVLTAWVGVYLDTHHAWTLILGGTLVAAVDMWLG